MFFDFSKLESSLALVDTEGTCITYGQLKLVQSLLQNNFCARSLIFILCTNTPGSLLGYITCLNNGVVPLLLDANIDKDLFEKLYSIYKPDYVWLPQDSSFKEGFSAPIHEEWNYSLIKTPYTQQYPLHEDLALLLTTSGSTGSPKLVRHSYENLRSNIAAIAEYLELDASERAITTLPMHYTYGLSVLNIHLSVGASLIMTDHTVMQKEFWQLCKEHEATSLAGVPYTYEMLHRLRFFRMDLPNIKSLNQAGGKMPPELQKQFIEYAEQTGRKFYVMYGQTEASPRMGYLPWHMAKVKYGSMGIPITGGSFALINEMGDEIQDCDTVGELVYKGPNVTLGYAECGEDLCKGDERRGILNTGDMAKVDAEGFYTIVGRQKRFLKIFGNRVSLDATEHLIKEEFENIQCICAGIDNKMHIFVLDEALCQPVRSFISQKTKLHFSAFLVKCLETFPVSDSGKILYKELEQYYDK